MIWYMQPLGSLPVKHAVIKASPQKRTHILTRTPFLIADNPFGIRIYKYILSNEKIIFTIAGGNSLDKNTADIANPIFLVKKNTPLLFNSFSLENNAALLFRSIYHGKINPIILN